MIDLLAVIVITMVIITLTLQLYVSVSTTPKPVQKQAPKVSIERINWLYQNDYNDFLTVKKELEERGWYVIFIKNETLG